VSVDIDSLSFQGRTYSGWGETVNQNLEHMLQHFAAAAAPSDPVTGMLWFDLSTGLLKIWDGVSFAVVNSAAFAPASSAKVPFSAVANVPFNITHNLNSSTPYIVMVQFFVDTGGGVYKMIMPSDITFVNANTIQVTFTAAYTGYALVRL
jgi:hypothetical protein